MAKYKKVKRYHRSFYSPGMWVKKAVGIIVLVAVVLVVGWLAAPHVLDWATHTWYTVVRNRDLSASSETTASSAAASSEVTAKLAASSEVRADSEPGSEPAAPAGVIIEGSWGVLDTAAAKDEASLRAAARQLAQQGAAYAVVTLKDSAGNILYPSQVAAAAGSIEGASLDPALIASVLRENGLVPVAKLAAFRDPAAARANHNGIRTILLCGKRHLLAGEVKCLIPRNGLPLVCSPLAHTLHGVVDMPRAIYQVELIEALRADSPLRKGAVFVALNFHGDTIFGVYPYRAAVITVMTTRMVFFSIRSRLGIFGICLLQRGLIMQANRCRNLGNAR